MCGYADFTTLAKLAAVRETSGRIDIYGRAVDVQSEFFTNLIDYAQGIDENIKKKPSPDAIFAIIEKLNAQNEKNIFIGDSEVDIETAQNANIPCISVSWGFKTKEFLIQHNASHIIDTPLELLEVIDKL